MKKGQDKTGGDTYSHSYQQRLKNHRLFQSGTPGDGPIYGHLTFFVSEMAWTLAGFDEGHRQHVGVTEFLHVARSTWRRSSQCLSMSVNNPQSNCMVELSILFGCLTEKLVDLIMRLNS